MAKKVLARKLLKAGDRIQNKVKDTATVVLVGTSEVLVRYDLPKDPAQPYTTLGLPLSQAWSLA